MKLKTVYLLLCLAGTILPLFHFLRFARDHGLDPARFIEQLFATPISSFFGWDVIVSTLVLWAFVFTEGSRLGMRQLWAPIAGSLTVGVSLGLPLFLLMREHQRPQTQS